MLLGGLSGQGEVCGREGRVVLAWNEVDKREKSFSQWMDKKGTEVEEAGRLGLLLVYGWGVGVWWRTVVVEQSAAYTADKGALGRAWCLTSCLLPPITWWCVVWVSLSLTFSWPPSPSFCFLSPERRNASRYLLLQTGLRIVHRIVVGRDP